MISQAVSRLAVEKVLNYISLTGGRNKEFCTRKAKVIVGDIRDIKSSKNIA